MHISCTNALFSHSWVLPPIDAPLHISILTLYRNQYKTEKGISHSFLGQLLAYLEWITSRETLRSSGVESLSLPLPIFHEHFLQTLRWKGNQPRLRQAKKYFRSYLVNSWLKYTLFYKICKPLSMGRELEKTDYLLKLRSLEINLRQELLTRSTALSPSFEGGDGKRRSGSIMSKLRPLGRRVEGLILN